MSADLRSGSSVDASWLQDILKSSGYEPTVVDSRTVWGKHPGSRPNVRLTVHHELGLITIFHFWHLKKGGLGSHKDLMEKINKANAQSWRDTFYIDSDGDLGVSSYITLAEQMSPQEIQSFLEQESVGFATTVFQTGLVQHVQ
jgi:Putative bacterial sensory transduction regulator